MFFSESLILCFIKSKAQKRTSNISCTDKRYNRHISFSIQYLAHFKFNLLLRRTCFLTQILFFFFFFFYGIPFSESQIQWQCQQIRSPISYNNKLDAIVLVKFDSSSEYCFLDNIQLFVESRLDKY